MLGLNKDLLHPVKVGSSKSLLQMNLSIARLKRLIDLDMTFDLTV